MNLEIKGFERYSVSEWGEVFGVRGKLKPCFDKRGYKRVWLYDSEGRRFEKYIHRLVAECFVDGDKSLTVNHKDGNKVNNHKSNLEWISNADNLRHSFKEGLRDARKTWKTRRFINNGYLCIDSKQQDAIVSRFLKGGISRRQLAKDFKVNRGTIDRLIKERTVS